MMTEEEEWERRERVIKKINDLSNPSWSARFPRHLSYGWRRDGTPFPQPKSLLVTCDLAEVERRLLARAEASVLTGLSRQIEACISDQWVLFVVSLAVLGATVGTVAGALFAVSSDWFVWSAGGLLIAALSALMIRED